MRQTRPAVFVFVLLLVSAAVQAAPRTVDGPTDARVIAASRHYVLSPERVLTPEDEVVMAKRGIRVVRTLAEGRYLVRVAPGRSLDEANAEPLTAGRKVFRDALRAAVAGEETSRINLVFHDDVAFEDARAIVSAAGGYLEDPLQIDYQMPRRIAVRVPSKSIMRLAADERVLLVRGPMRLRVKGNNAFAASVSSVNVVQAAPYGLTGAGVALSFFELGAADAAHPEFGGRLTTTFTGGPTSEQQHATHVAGTMIASGVDPSAKGMAPGATLREYRATDDDAWDKKDQLDDFSVVADNNSWSFIVGWCEPADCDGSWRWEDTEELLGGYDVFYSAPLDAITIDANVLMVHSSGNEAQKLGPTVPPFSHKHTNNLGQVIPNKTFCYAAAGSTTCPTPCTDCETTPHPVNAPWSSIGPTASAKNVLTVGAVNAGKNFASFTSRGPMRDGRIKPELVADGVSVRSTFPNNSYALQSGTSMATPVVTGIAALLTEQWRRTFGGETPKPAVLKTLLIAGAEDLGNPGPDYTHGFGLANAKASVDLIIADNAAGRAIRRAEATQGSQIEFPLQLDAAGRLRVTLGWSDPEVLIFPDDGVAVAALVNDLDLRVIDAAGNATLPYVLNKDVPEAAATRGNNTVDNVEMVEIANAPAGRYRVIVSGTNVARGPQPYVLVANGDLNPPVVCADGNEPNGTDATASVLFPSTAKSGRLCGADDVDLFTFNASGNAAVSVNVAATDTALRVTLTGEFGTTATTTIQPGNSANLVSTYNGPGTAPESRRYVLRVEPFSSTLGPDGAYTITANFTPNVPPRRRAVRR